MKPSLPLAGGTLLLAVCSASFAPVWADSPAPVLPPRLDFQIQPSPAPAPELKLLTNRYPMVVVEADPAAYPMPVTTGRVGNYPIPVIPPRDLAFSATPPLSAQPAAPLYRYTAPTSPAQLKR